MDETKTPRSPHASRTEMTEFVLPQHANALGTVFGGQVLSWIDLCAAICAMRYTGHTAVTAEFDDVSFLAPIRVGQVVRLSARVTAAFRTSVEIAVDVEGEDAPSGRRWPTARAFVTFVAVNEALEPTAVPPLRCETEEDRRFVAEAQERRKLRLARRNR